MINGQLSAQEIKRYSRHLMLPGVGLAGQRMLSQASVLVVGCGGLGSAAALYLAAAGIGRIGLVDHDQVEISNLQRQLLHNNNTLGQPKVTSGIRRLQELNPHIKVEGFPVKFCAANAWSIAEGYDFLLDGSDNLTTRYLLNDLAFLSKRPYVYGAVFQFEGQASVFDARRGPCYRCLFPSLPPPGLAPISSESGILSTVPGVVGILQANEVLKCILKIGEPLIGSLLLYDALDSSFQTVRLHKNPLCRLCNAQPEITSLVDIPGWEETYAPPADWLVEPQELAHRLSHGENIQLLDVREPVEQQVSILPNSTCIPLGLLSTRLHELDQSRPLCVICRTGTRAALAVNLLRQAGFHMAHLLNGGLNAWARQVDAQMLEY
jgi:molybdopterin/thiamine biosynthesis adenylyltransferase/rhodanese-related sulfurtransferase